jgi:hypothetical protein
MLIRNKCQEVKKIIHKHPLMPWFTRGVKKALLEKNHGYLKFKSIKANEALGINKAWCV